MSQTRTKTSNSNQRGGGRGRGGYPRQNNSNRGQQESSGFNSSFSGNRGQPNSSGFNSNNRGSRSQHNSSGLNSNNRGHRGHNQRQGFKPGRGRSSGRGSNNSKEPASWTSVASRFMLENSDSIINTTCKLYDVLTSRYANETDTADSGQSQGTNNEHPPGNFAPGSNEERHRPEEAYRSNLFETPQHIRPSAPGSYDQRDRQGETRATNNNYSQNHNRHTFGNHEERQHSENFHSKQFGSNQLNSFRNSNHQPTFSNYEDRQGSEDFNSNWFGSNPSNNSRNPNRPPGNFPPGYNEERHHPEEPYRSNMFEPPQHSRPGYYNQRHRRGESGATNNNYPQNNPHTFGNHEERQRSESLNSNQFGSNQFNSSRDPNRQPTYSNGNLDGRQRSGANHGTRYGSNQSDSSRNQNRQPSSTLGYPEEVLRTTEFKYKESDTDILNNENESIFPIHSNAVHQPDRTVSGSHDQVCSPLRSGESSSFGTNRPDVNLPLQQNGKGLPVSSTSTMLQNDSTSQVGQSSNNVECTKSKTAVTKAQETEDIQKSSMISDTKANKGAKTKSAVDMERRKKILLAYGFKVGSDEPKSNINVQQTKVERKDERTLPIQHVEGSLVSPKTETNFECKVLPQNNSAIRESNRPNKQISSHSEKTLGEDFVSQLQKFDDSSLKNENLSKPVNKIETNSDQMLDISHQVDDYKNVLPTQRTSTFPNFKRNKCPSKEEARKGARLDVNEVHRYKDNLTPGQFSGVPHFNIQQPAAGRNQRVASRDDAMHRIQEEYYVKAAEQLAKEEQKAAKKREEYLAKYKHIDQGHRMTEGPLDRIRFEHEQALLREEEVRQLQQERLRRDTLEYQKRQQEENERQRLKEEEKRQELLAKHRHVDAGYRLGHGDGGRRTPEGVGSVEETYDNDYNEDLYADYNEEGVYDPQQQLQEDEHHHRMMSNRHQGPEYGNTNFGRWQGEERVGGRSHIRRRSPSPANQRGLTDSISPDLLLEGETEEEFLQRQEEQLILEALIQSQINKKEDEEEAVRRAIELSEKESRMSQNVKRENTSGLGAPQGAVFNVRPDPLHSLPKSNNRQFRPTAPPMTTASNASISGTSSSNPTNTNLPKVYNSATSNVVKTPASTLMTASKPSNAGMSGSITPGTSSVMDVPAPSNHINQMSKVLNLENSKVSNKNVASSSGKPSSQTFSDMKQFFIPNSNKSPNNLGIKPAETERHGSPPVMSRSQSQHGAAAAPTPACKVIRSQSQGAVLVLRPTEEALNKALAQKLVVHDEMDRLGHSENYKPNVQPEPLHSNNRYDRNYQPTVDIGRATGAIPKQRTAANPPPLSAEEQSEIDYQAEMRAARLRMQQKYEEALKAKQQNQDST